MVGMSEWWREYWGGVVAVGCAGVCFGVLGFAIATIPKPEPRVTCVEGVSYVYMARGGGSSRPYDDGRLTLHVGRDGAPVACDE